VSYKTNAFKKRIAAYKKSFQKRKEETLYHMLTQLKDFFMQDGLPNQAVPSPPQEVQSLRGKL